jgi:hypothetical protein
MNYWGHAATSTTAVIVLAIIMASRHVEWVSGLSYLVFFAGFSFADQDLRLEAHRSWFFHSAIPAILLLGFVLLVPGAGPREAAGAALFLISHGTHLACDVKPGKTGKKGTYLIYLGKFNRMSVKHTDEWLLGNAATCIALAVLLASGG